MKKIEFGEIRVGEIARQHIQDCLDKNWVTEGEKVRLFEEKWKALFGCKHAIAVNSGTTAGILACMAMYEFGGKPSTGYNGMSEIICPALSFISSGNSIRIAGFRPRFVDVKMDMNINEAMIEQNINENTVAIKVVNLMGVPANLERIKGIAEKHDLIVILDEAESYGCTYNDKYALDFGHVNFTSFFTAHLIQSCEGSMMGTNDDNIAEILRSSRTHGREGGDREFNHIRIGLNGRMTDLHACIGLQYIEDFHKIFDKRRENIKYLTSRIEKFDDKITYTKEALNTVNCPHALSIILKYQFKHQVNTFRQFLEYKGIHTKRNFGAIPDHECFAYLNEKGRYTHATYIGNAGFHIGCHYYLSDSDLEYIGDQLEEFLTIMKEDK